MHVCVDGTPNLCCAVCAWFAYHSPQTKICQFFAQTQRELDAQGVLCLSQVCKKLINRALLTRRMRTAQRVSGALVYTKLKAMHVTCLTHGLFRIAEAIRSKYKVVDKFIGSMKNIFGVCLVSVFGS